MGDGRAAETGTEALRAALADWRRHAVAVAIVLAAFGLASLAGSRIATFAAWLVAFSVWMLWFVITTIEWVRYADF